MKFYKKIFPYFLGAASLLPHGRALAAAPEPVSGKSADINTENILLDKKAGDLRDAYVMKSVAGCQNLHGLRGKRGYVAAVNRELPGAPVGRHCLYGQSFQLSRALNEQGDTMSIIPNEARQSCVAFKTQMKKQYAGTQYAGCLQDGRMFESDSAYAAALDNYLAGRKIDAGTSAEVRNAAIADFAARNFSLDAIEPGAVLIVPRFRGSQRLFHAVMYLGRGRMENGVFVADNNGRHIYSGYNNETIGDLFKTYDTSNVFAADIKKIAQVKYTRELSRIKGMSREELLRFLNTHSDRVVASRGIDAMTKADLVRTACDVFLHSGQIIVPESVMRDRMQDELADSIAKIQNLALVPERVR